MEQQGKSGSATTSYKLRLYDRHFDWIYNTIDLYNQITEFYYKLLLKHSELLELDNYKLLRQLEILTIGTREMKAEGKIAEYSLTEALTPKTAKPPMYFRRAAINHAVSQIRSYKTRYSIWEAERSERLIGTMENMDSNGILIGMPTEARIFHASPVFYKGMYRNFTETSIELKLFNGKKWVWTTYPYTGRSLPKEAKILSPFLKVHGKTAYLHVPVATMVQDIRTVNERMKTEDTICAVSFPDNDSLAVCAMMNKEGKMIDSFFMHGGDAREEQRKKILTKLEKSWQSRGKRERTGKDRKEEISKENASLLKKLEQVNQYYAHTISKKILDYCMEKKIKVIVVPNYDRPIDFQDKQYLNTNPYRWQGRAMIRNLKYKAFKEGIVVTTIRPYHISDCCSVCGEKIRKYNEGHPASKDYYGGRLFICPNGHQGNTALNTAKNIGRYFLRRFQEETAEFEIKTVGND